MYGHLVIFFLEVVRCPQFDPVSGTLSMSNERKEDGEASPSVYTVGSEHNLVAVRSRDTYFKRRKNRTLMILIIAFLMATLLVAVVVLAVLYSKLYRAQNICDNENCMRIAASLKESMDTSINPCDDFYGYVCGRWTEEHHSSESDNSWFNERSERITWKVRELLGKNMTESEAPWAVLQAKKLYDSCMDVESIDHLGLKPLLSVLEKVDLPPTPAALTGKHGNVVEIMAKVRRLLGKDVFFGVEVFPDPRNKSRNVVMLDTPTWSSPLPSYNAEMEKRMKTVRSRYTKLEDEPDEDANGPLKKPRRPVKTYMAGVIREIVSNGTASNCSFKDEATDSRDREVDKITDMIYDLSEAFYRISSSEINSTVRDEDVSDEDYILVEQLQKTTDEHVKEMNSSLVPREIWRPFMEELFRDVKDLDLSKELLLIGNLEYLKDAAYLLASTDDTDLETAIWWIVVDIVVPHSSKSLKILWEEYMSDLIAYEPSQTRSLYCAEVASWMMGMAVSWLVVDPDFHVEKGTKVIEMLEDIRYAFSTIVVNADWMDRRTQLVTLEKARKMTYVIGHPSWLFEEGMLDDYYEGIDMKDDRYLENMLTMIKLMSEQELKVLHDYNSMNDSYWPADPIDVNALHSFVINHITVPEGILQFPFYELGLEALNYGAIGTILGHELTHGFDNNGRLYDKDGNFRQWWSDSTIDQYYDKIECFIKHYSGYYVDEVGDYIDGELTLDENIADNGGLREAVLAYKRWKRRHGQEPLLPGFTHLTHEQLLFLGFAHVWCERNSAESLRWRLLDTHCPGYVRLKGVLQNSPEFSEAWKCPVGSGMNPEKKCRVW